MPVLDHEINERVRIYSTEPYCVGVNRKAGYWAQDGWYNDGTRKPIFIHDTMSQLCRYDKRPTDPRCGDCNLPSDEEYFKEMGL